MKALRAIVCSVAAAMLVFATASAARAEPLSVDDVLSPPTVRDVIVGPNGSIAWVEEAGGAWNVFCIDRLSGVARRLTANTNDDGIELNLIGFALAGREVVYVRGRPGFAPANPAMPTAPVLEHVPIGGGLSRQFEIDTRFANEKAATSPDGRWLAVASGGQVWALDMARGGQPTQWLSLRGDVTSIVFSPDSRRIAFVEDQSVLGRGRVAFVGVYEPGAPTVRYMAPGLGVDQDVVWAMDSRRLAFVRIGFEARSWRFSNNREGAPFELVTANAETGEAQSVWRSSPGYGGRFNGFSVSDPTGLGGRNNLAWLADDTLVFPYEHSGWKLLYGVSANGGEARLLTPGRFEVDGMAVAPGRRRLTFWSNSQRRLEQLELHELSLDNGLSATAIPGAQEGRMRFEAAYANDESLAYLAASATAPTRLMLLQGEHERPLSSPPWRNEETARRVAHSVVTPQPVSFSAPDGTIIRALLYRPTTPSPAGRRRPVLIHAHGGSRDKVYPIWRTSFGYPQVLMYMASRGYIVLSVNYRSGTGYGLDFREPDSYGARGAGELQDFLAAADYIERAVPEADPRRMALFGHSYGGHIVANLLARTNRFRAGIVSAGVTDWVYEMEQDSGAPIALPLPERLAIETVALESSAISHIDTWGSEPVLIMHGGNDASAPIRQSVDLLQALRRRSITAEYRVFPGDGHNLRLAANQRAYLRAIDDFLARYNE